MSDLLFTLAVNASIRAAVLVTAVAIILNLFRIRSSSTRHAAWATVLVVMLVMPVLTRIVPAVRVSVPERAMPLVVPAAPPSVDPPLPALPSSITSAQRSATTSSVAPPALAPGNNRSVTTPVQWNEVGLVAYLACLSFFLVRFLIGFGQLTRIRRSAKPVTPMPGAVAWESALVATPVTIGLLTPRAILPVTWRDWSPKMLAAVLAHERAHATRRDPLIAALARLNSAIFWFHPLAWWLEHTLATLAEHACDDAALAHVPRRRYAEALLDIAETVRRHQGRLVWQGVGVDGDGRLGRRIDRVLSEAAWPRPSRARVAALSATCAIAIVAAVACRQAEQSPPPLREDPDVAARFKANAQRADARRAAQQMTVAEGAALEKMLEQNPEDMAIREKLLAFYRWTGRNTQPWNDNIAARRRHALWLVEHHPDSDLVKNVRLLRAEDQVGYDKLKRLWLAAADPRADARVITNATWFIGLSEKRVAEQILLRARAADPDGPNAQQWARQLGGIYGDAIREADYRNGRTSTLSDTKADPDAAWAREKLERSNDPDVLWPASQHLSMLPRDDAGFGTRLLERASRLQGPGAEVARRLLRMSNEMNPQVAAFGSARTDSWPEMLAKSTGIVRLRQLNTLAEHEYKGAEYRHWLAGKLASNPQTSKTGEEEKRAATEGFAKSKQHAREALQLASSLNDSSAREEAFRAHIMYGLAVFREGDRKGALRHLKAASKLPVPGGRPVGRWASGHEYRLVFALLEHGERQTVIDYFERAAQGRDEARRTVMLTAAAAIRDGRMPEHYQYLVASGHL
jgi:beta-lactamase regulating signal transducer with metallopeptidase domain